jgi:hypothetical protein
VDIRLRLGRVPVNRSAGVFLVTSVCLGLLAACSDSTGSSGSEPGRVHFFSYPFPAGVSPDGKTVMFQDLSAATGAEIYLYDVATRKLSLATQAGSNFNDIAHGLSNNGVIASAYSNPVQAAVWSPADGWQTMASPFTIGCDIFAGEAWSVSSDGSVAVGQFFNGCRNEAFMSRNGVTTMLERVGTPPDLDSIPASRASVVSNDGTTAGGYTTFGLLDRRPAVWHSDGSGLLLPTGGVFADDCPGQVNALSVDGTIAGGVWCQHAFYWTQAGGPVDLGQLPGTDINDQAFVNAISANGQLMFGTNGDGFFGPQNATVWTAAKGTRLLQDVAGQYLVQIPAGATLLTASKASADGTVVIGQAIDGNGHFATYVLTMPVSAYGL